MKKGKRGRKPWKAPDGVATQPPWQTAKATSVPRSGGKKNIYDQMRRPSKFGKVKPGYGKTGRFA